MSAVTNNNCQQPRSAGKKSHHHHSRPVLPSKKAVIGGGAMDIAAAATSAFFPAMKGALSAGIPMMPSAPRRRDISLLMLLLAAETVVSVAQPHIMGVSASPLSGLGLAGAATASGGFGGVNGIGSDAGSGAAANGVNAPQQMPALSTEILAMALQQQQQQQGSAVASPLRNGAKVAASVSPFIDACIADDSDGGASDSHSSSGHKNSSAGATPLPGRNVVVDAADASAAANSDNTSAKPLNLSSATSVDDEEEGAWALAPHSSSSQPPHSQPESDDNEEDEMEQITSSVDTASSTFGLLSPATMAAAAQQMRRAVAGASFASSTAFSASASSAAAKPSFLSISAGALYAARIQNATNANANTASADDCAYAANASSLLQSVLSFLNWREAITVRGVSKSWFVASLGVASVCRMPTSLAPAVFIPYPFQHGGAGGQLNGPAADSTTSSAAGADNSGSRQKAPFAFGGNIVYAGLSATNNNYQQQAAGNHVKGTHHGAHAHPSSGGEALHWNSQTRPWLCAACGHTNSPYRATCNNNSNTNPHHHHSATCNAVNPSHWNSQRLFMGQLRRSGTIPFVLWLLRDVMGVDIATNVMAVENHRDRNTGRGKGCAWVTVATHGNTTAAAGALLSLHHRAFFDTIHGVEGIWLTAPDTAAALDSESALRSQRQPTSAATATGILPSADSQQQQQIVALSPAVPAQHPRHMPRSSIVAEETSPQQNLPQNLFGRGRNFPLHFIRATAANAGEGESEKAPAAEVRFVHNPYYVHRSTPAAAVALPSASASAVLNGNGPSPAAARRHTSATPSF